MINTTSLTQARKQIQELRNQGKEVIVQAQDDNFNRKIFENKDIVVIGLEFNKEDFLKQRNSGLNEVLCKLAKTNNIKIGIDISKIVRLDKIEKARVLSRVKQNIMLCKKAGCKMVIICNYGKNYNKNYGKEEIMSFFLSLGGSTRQGKEASQTINF